MEQFGIVLCTGARLPVYDDVDAAVAHSAMLYVLALIVTYLVSALLASLLFGALRKPGVSCKGCCVLHTPLSSTWWDADIANVLVGQLAMPLNAQGSVTRYSKS